MKKKVVAMLLAGGKGSRLGVLTQHTAKPAIHFGGKYRIIDFPLSNCVNSDIDTVGVLTQYQPLELNAYIGIGQPWDLDRNNGGVFVLPPFMRGKQGEWYKGTANAIFQNMAFVDQYEPKCVLILGGDHIYKMDYAAMVDYHIAKGADATIATLNVPLSEAFRFGIMNADDDNRVYQFEEKPKKPVSNRASMGVYVFTWEVLRSYLISDYENPKSTNDFGHDIIPKMIEEHKALYAYDFKGYWKDVGTVKSLWDANMDLLDPSSDFDLHDSSWRIYSRNRIQPPHYIGAGATVTNSLVTEGCSIYGEVRRSVLFPGVTVEEGATVKDSVIMPGTHIRKGAVITHSIVGESADIGENSVIGDVPLLCETYSPLDTDGITVVGNGTIVKADTHIAQGDVIDWPKEDRYVY